MAMTPETVPVESAVPRSRIVVASMVGTSIEFFDFYIYATAAVLVFPTLFFPRGMTPRRCCRRSRRSGWPSSPAPSAPWCSGISAIGSAVRPPSSDR
ncbi:hypothetical protein R2325_15065 [Mycobacteroides chelonae]|nr:hypothetical protein [Mycobacteroides chelonae]